MLEAELSESTSVRIELETELAAKTAELAAAFEMCNSLEARVASLQTELSTTQAEFERVQSELKVLLDVQAEHETSSVARNKFEELETAHMSCQGKLLRYPE